MRPCRCPGSRLHIYRTPTDSLASVAGVCGCGPALFPGNVWSCTLEAHGLQIQGRRLCCGLRDRDVGQGEGVQGSGSLWGCGSAPATLGCGGCTGLGFSLFFFSFSSHSPPLPPFVLRDFRLEQIVGRDSRSLWLSFIFTPTWSRFTATALSCSVHVSWTLGCRLWVLRLCS